MAVCSPLRSLCLLLRVFVTAATLLVGVSGVNKHFTVPKACQGFVLFLRCAAVSWFALGVDDSEESERGGVLQIHSIKVRGKRWRARQATFDQDSFFAQGCEELRTRRT